MYWLSNIIVTIGVAVILPVFILWIIYRYRTNRTNKNTEIILKALENRTAVDTDKLIDALSSKAKTPPRLKEQRLLRGCIFTLCGLASLGLALLAQTLLGDDEGEYAFLVLGFFFFAIGISYLIVFFTARNTAD